MLRIKILLVLVARSLAFRSTYEKWDVIKEKEKARWMNVMDILGRR